MGGAAGKVPLASGRDCEILTTVKKLPRKTRRYSRGLSQSPAEDEPN